MSHVMRALFLVTWLLCGGCGPGGAGFAVALGSTGTLPTWQGSCDTESARGDALTIDGASFAARRVGRTTLTCARGELYVDVREVERLEIEGPDEVDGRAVYFRLRAFGDGRELDLGSGAVVSWLLEGSLVRDASCTDVLGTCAGPTSVRLHATASGSGRIRASFAGMSAERALTLREGVR